MDGKKQTRNRPKPARGGFGKEDAMTAYRVIIPEENYQLIKFRQDDLPGIGVINEALCDFDSKIVFAWHLSLMIHFDYRIDNDPEWKLAEWHLKAARAEPCIAPNVGPATQPGVRASRRGRHR